MSSTEQTGLPAEENDGMNEDERTIAKLRESIDTLLGKKWALEKKLATAKADALREAADEYRSGQLTGMFLGRDDYTKAWLRARADQLTN